MMDGQLFKEKHHRVLDGRDPNQHGCDVTRQTGTSFSSCRDVKQGSLSRVDSIITLPREARIRRGGEKWRDSGAERATSQPCWPDFSVRLAFFFVIKDFSLILCHHVQSSGNVFCILALICNGDSICNLKQ